MRAASMSPSVPSNSPRRSLIGNRGRSAPYPATNSSQIAGRIVPTTHTRPRSSLNATGPQRPSGVVNDVMLSSDEAFSITESDALNEVIMALDMKQNGDLGCAYYIAVDEVLYLLEDIAMAGVELIETLLLHTQPTTILLSSRAPEALVQALERNADRPGADKGWS